MKEIEDILGFIVEIEKLKDVHRKTKPVGLDRYENSAEHSWHVCLTALMLKDYSNEDIDILRVIKMLLIHDLGEIHAGDSIIYASETAELKAEEEAGIRRLVEMLPATTAEEFMQLWQEFEAGKTAESRYAKAIDRVPPLLHNIHGNGHSWKKHGITQDKILAVNQRIESGSEQLWSVMRNKLEKAFEGGVLE